MKDSQTSPATVRIMAAAIGVIFAAGLGSSFAATAREPVLSAEPIKQATINRVYQIEQSAAKESQTVQRLPEQDDDFLVGGLSDLAFHGGHLWAITDRGPNGTIDSVGGGKRTLLKPGFVPSLLLLESVLLDGGESFRAAGKLPVKRVVPLRGRSGKPVSGRPNGIGRDLPAYDAQGNASLGVDPNGIDCEGVVVLDDGTFWITEEYRPSLLHVSAEGRVLGRHVPQGIGLPGADTTIQQTLPAAYGLRQDNRGFEAIALAPDESKLYALLQSPLENPHPKAAHESGNVRLLVFGIQEQRAVAEHLYRLGDPQDKDFFSKGAPPSDGKLCAMACVNDANLLVLEQADGGIARLYLVSVESATDTLELAFAEAGLGPAEGAGQTLEQVRNVTAAGIVPVVKRLIADLADLLPTMTADAFGPDAGGKKKPRLKLEGLAILDSQHIVLLNDNDFGVRDGGKNASEDPPKSCLWIVTLPEPLSLVLLAGKK